MAHIQKTNSKMWMPESTHEKIDSQKMFIDNIEQMERNFMYLDRTMKMYKSLAEISSGFTIETPINTIIPSMANNSGLIVDIVNANNTVYPTQNGTLYIYKIRADRVQLEFVSNEGIGNKHYNKRWVGQSNTGVFGGWNDVYTLNNKPFYTTLDQLGLSSGCSINDVLAKMEYGSVAFFYNVTGGEMVTGLPIDNQCNVIIFKTNTFMAIVHDIWSGIMYTSTYSDTNTINGWKHLSDALTFGGLALNKFRGNDTGFEYGVKNGGDANSYKAEAHTFVFNMSNIPGGKSGFLTVDKYSGSGFTPTNNHAIIRQKFVEWDTGETYYRMHNGDTNTWTDWRSISTTTVTTNVVLPASVE